MIGTQTTLDLERTYVWSGWGLQYRVLVDEFEVGRLDNPQRFIRNHVVKPVHRITVPLEPGPHRVRLKSLWYASPIVVINPSGGEIVRMVCAQRTGIAALIQPRQAIRLDLLA